jgi:hypothetical protein
MATSVRLPSCTPINGTNQTFSQVLLGVRDDDRVPAFGVFEDVMRPGDANLDPSFALKTANDIAAVR